MTDTNTNPGAADVDFAHPKSKRVETLRKLGKSGTVVLSFAASSCSRVSNP